MICTQHDWWEADEDCPGCNVEAAPAIRHLHWLYHKGPQALIGVWSAGALCGKTGLAPGEVTSTKEITTCEECRRIANA